MAKPLRLPIIAFLLLAAVAQDKPAEPKFSSKASYVLLPVLITDNKGLPVYGLKAEDFTVEADKTAQPIASFDPPQKPESAVPKAAAPQPSTVEFSNINVERPRHLTIIALDPRNTPLSERKPTTDALLQFLAKAQNANDPVELIWLNEGRIEIIHRFTRDYAALADSVRKTVFPADTNYEIPIDTTKFVGGNNPAVKRSSKVLLEDMERQMQRQVEDDKSNQLAATMVNIADRYGRIPGPKTLVWVTHGFRLRMPDMVLGDGANHVNSGHGTPRDLWENAFRELANSNIAVYPLDARGLVAPQDIADKSDVDSNVPGLRPGDKNAAQTKAHYEFLSAFHWIADETGGMAFTGSNGFESALERATADANGTYMLSFRVPQGAKPGWHPIKVSVQHKGMNIVTRPGFWLEKKPRPSTETIEAALTSPFPFTGLPVMVRWTDVKPGGKKSQVGFQVAVPSSMPTSPDFSMRRVSIQVRTAVFDSNQKPVAGTKRDIVMDLDDTALEKLLRSAVSYKGVLELPAGEYEVAFAVKDNISGRVGSAIAPLTVK